MLFDRALFYGDNGIYFIFFFFYFFLYVFIIKYIIGMSWVMLAWMVLGELLLNDSLIEGLMLLVAFSSPLILEGFALRFLSLWGL